MLGNLCWIYDSNRITIEGHTDLASWEERMTAMDARRTENVSFPAPAVMIVMGVSGSGKSTIGALLARRLRWEFEDAD